MDLGFEERLNQVLAQAFERPPRERKSFIEQACEDDSGLLAEALTVLARRNAIDDPNAGDSWAGGDATTLLDRARWPEEAQGEPRPIASLSGATVGHYQLYELLGKGGMGYVYRAEDTRLGRVVAIKFLLFELNETAEAKSRFLREARSASKLDHPNICTVHEIDETDDGRPYMVMACYEGETLKQRLKRGPLPIEEAIFITRSVAGGLARAHREGIVHRDIKPGNIFVTEDGQVKVLDFGVAKVLGDAALTRTGLSIGTPYYMAPEQALGDPGPGSDLWALGVILYEMLTGERPFNGPHQTAIIQAVLNRDPTPVREKRPETPEILALIVERALQKDPEKRYQSANELAFALPVTNESSVIGLPMPELETAKLPKAEPRTEPTAQHDPAPPRGRSLLLPFIAGVLLTALLAAGWIYQQQRVASENPQQATATAPLAVAVLPFKVRGDDDFQYLSEGMVDLLSTKLDGAGNLRSIDSRALLRRRIAKPIDISDPESALDLVRQFDADLLILGNLFEVAGQLRFDASLYRIDDAKPRLAASADAEGSASEIFSLVDDLATQLLAQMNRGAASRMKRLAATTTESFQALKHYLEGETAWRAGRFRDAAVAFQDAVSEDPQFALAWYRLGLAHNWSLDLKGYNEALQKAVSHADRLTPDDRRLLEIAIALNDGDDVTAGSLLTEVLSRRPDDLEALSALGELEFHLGPLRGQSMVHSRRSWERVLELEPDDRQAHIHLARIEGYEEDYAALRVRNQRLEVLLAGSDRASESLFSNAMLPGASAERAELRQSLMSSDIGLPWLLAGYSLSNNHEYREYWATLYRELLANSGTPRAQAFANRHLGVLALAAGRLAEADRHLSSAARAPEQEQEHRALAATLPFLPIASAPLATLIATVEAWPTEPDEDFSFFEPNTLFRAHHRLYILALLVARQGDTERALALADELASLGEIPVAPGLERDMELGIRAEVARLRGQHSEVLSLLAERHGRYSYEMPMVSPLFSRARERYLKAEALLALGRTEEALGWYTSLYELAVFDLAYLGYSRLRRAEIHEQLGQPRQAAEQYRRLIELWSEADPELQPHVETARRRLAELST
ncbi:MAG: protein kinase [Acidobacteriota bacterium]